MGKNGPGGQTVKFSHPLARAAKIYAAKTRDGKELRTLVVVTTLSLEPGTSDTTKILSTGFRPRREEFLEQFQGRPAPTSSSIDRGTGRTERPGGPLNRALVGESLQARCANSASTLRMTSHAARSASSSPMLLRPLHPATIPAAMASSGSAERFKTGDDRQRHGGVVALAELLLQRRRPPSIAPDVGARGEQRAEEIRRVTNALEADAQLVALFGLQRTEVAADSAHLPIEPFERMRGECGSRLGKPRQADRPSTAFRHPRRAMNCSARITKRVVEASLSTPSRRRGPPPPWLPPPRSACANPGRSPKWTSGPDRADSRNTSQSRALPIAVAIRLASKRKTPNSGAGMARRNKSTPARS